MNLLYFRPANAREEEYFNFDKHILARFRRDLDRDAFYLGGQLHMKHNDMITVDIIHRIQMSNEGRSLDVYTARKELEFIEQMLYTYHLLMLLRENC